MSSNRHTTARAVRKIIRKLSRSSVSWEIMHCGEHSRSTKVPCRLSTGMSHFQLWRLFRAYTYARQLLWCHRLSRFFKSLNGPSIAFTNCMPNALHVQIRIDDSIEYNWRITIALIVNFSEYRIFWKSCLLSFILITCVILFTAIMINCALWKEKSRLMNYKYHSSGKMRLIVQFLEENLV